MAKKKIFEDRINTIMFAILAIGILGWLIWSIYGVLWLPEKDNKTIKFEVTGISNSENASTLVQIHYECMKYCIYEYGDYGLPVQDCWNECAKLGKEGCNE